ncbi:MAG: ABC transporter permease [Tepidisphaerales bacterium]
MTRPPPVPQPVLPVVPPGERRPLPHIVWPLFALALLLIFDFFFVPGFFQFTIRDGRLQGSLIDILNRGVPVMLLAMGMTLVIATGGVDLSVGSVMAICSAVAACLIARPERSPLSVIDISSHIYLIVFISILVGLMLGMWNGALVAFLDLQPIIATLILMVAGRGIAQIFTDSQKIETHSGVFTAISRGSFLGLPRPVSIAALAFILMAAFTRLTAAGLFVESVGNNPAAARIAGVRASFVKVMAYAITGALAAIAGVIRTADIDLADPPGCGINHELDAILAVVIGGTALTGGRFSLVGTLVGAILIQTLTTTVLNKGFNPNMTLVLKAGVVIAVCLLQAPKFRKLLGFPGKSA